MQIDEVQKQVDRWIQEIGGYWNGFQILAQLTEELGELAAALQRQDGLRPRKVEADVEEELGDLFFTIAAFANLMHIDLEQAFTRTMKKYELRDAQAWKNKESGS